MIDKKFITNLQGKEFIKFEGLLNLFHEGGGRLIDTEELGNSTPERPLFKAKVSGEKGIFTGHGDADSDNVNSMIGKHKYRMAETRAIARALRWYNNIGMCSADEMGGDDKVTTKAEDPNDYKKLLLNKVKHFTGKEDLEIGSILTAITMLTGEDLKKEDLTQEKCKQLISKCK